MLAFAEQLGGAGKLISPIFKDTQDLGDFWILRQGLPRFKGKIVALWILRVVLKVQQRAVPDGRSEGWQRFQNTLVTLRGFGVLLLVFLGNGYDHHRRDVTGFLGNESFGFCRHWAGASWFFGRLDHLQKSVGSLMRGKTLPCFGTNLHRVLRFRHPPDAVVTPREVVGNLRITRKSTSTVFEQSCGPPVITALVNKPAEQSGNTRIIRRQRMSILRQTQCSRRLAGDPETKLREPVFQFGIFRIAFYGGIIGAEGQIELAITFLDGAEAQRCNGIIRVFTHDLFKIRDGLRAGGSDIHRENGQVTFSVLFSREIRI